MTQLPRLTLAAIHPAEIQAVRELRIAEARGYLDAVEHLREHATGASLLEMAQRNLQEFEAAVTSAGSNIPIPGQRGNLQRELSLELNRKFLNFLTAFRQFLDHTEARLKHRYQPDSPIISGFKARTAAAYDSHFAYRFLYRLRNFGQHLAIPIGFVGIESKALERLPGAVLHQVHLKFDRDKLLVGGEPIWGKGPVLKELSAMPSHFAVEPYARIVMAELVSIWAAIQGLERPTLEGLANQIATICSDAFHARLTPAVVRPYRKGGKTHYEFHQPPIEIMLWLGHNQWRDFL